MSNRSSIVLYSVWPVFAGFMFFFKQKTAYDRRISDWSSDGALPICLPMNMNTLTSTIRGYYLPYGVLLPVQMYAWLATRHSKLYNVGPEATGWIAMACREHAQLNDRALTCGQPMTMDDYMRSRMVCRSEERRVGQEGVSTGRFRGSPEN